MILEGPRVTLAPLAEGDRPAFAAINADPAVMRHFASAMTRAESDAFQDRIAAHFAEHGFGFWGVFDRRSGALAGLCGLAHIPWDAHFTPAVEIGWRLAPAFQGQGLAEEAARLALATGFGQLRLPEIVAFTVPANTRSVALMRRLGMVADGGFDHPRLPPDHPLRPHLLYRLSRADWVARVFS
ncbi:GNAT family N-acetyltransferase [Humitalea sp. 24SJ18S-53]|uniref:GNAT family N-acetyltransferase n=1 Tax=Humitalea sp. 24SJ18S-53 TaxID=3422307 RepID=UPI003D679E27